MITVIYIIYRFSAEFVSSCQVIQDHVSGSLRENNSAVVSTNLLSLCIYIIIIIYVIIYIYTIQPVVWWVKLFNCLDISIKS